MSGAKAERIDKIIARLQSRISEGQYYEAQQQTRVVAARHLKAENWDAALEILFGVAQSLLKAGQGGSGGDLAIMMVDVLRQAGRAPDASSKGKVLTLLRLFDDAEPTRKKYIGEMIGWSAKLGPYPAGDPELHHVAGSLYAAAALSGSSAAAPDPYAAERHLVLGTKDSPALLARLEHAWYLSDAPHTAAMYAGRAVLPYLLVANLRSAGAAMAEFTSLLGSNGGASGGAATAQSQSVSSATADARIYPSLPLLNFLTLLLLAVRRGRESADLFRQLVQKYRPQLDELDGAWDEALEMIAEMYFGIARPRKSNPLLDMMGSLFGGGGMGGGMGGGPGAGAQQQRRTGPGRVDAPAAEGLD